MFEGCQNIHFKPTEFDYENYSQNTCRFRKIALTTPFFATGLFIGTACAQQEPLLTELAKNSNPEAAFEPESAYLFKPKVTTILGSYKANAAEAFSRIFNQTKGELAIEKGEFVAKGGLSLNWLEIIRMFDQPKSPLWAI